MSKLAVITGVGPGTGSALAHRFHAGGYRVVMLARNGERLRTLEQSMPGSIGVTCNVADTVELEQTLAGIEVREGLPQVVIHNAVGGAFGTFQEIDPDVLQRNFQVNVMALLHLARWAAPGMEREGSGTILATGNTSALRGKAKFAGFAPTKAAQRILAESMARELGPKGVHVAYLMIDAVIDVPWTRERYPQAPDSFFIRPQDIAEEAWHVAHQPRSAWSFLIELRPFAESW
jgi:NAD(P)-dependent dehydrogenase (short-subunit alcohol dehydrogenase family)